MQQGIDNLSKIREILFGEYQNSVEDRIHQVEANITEQFERLSAEVRAITNSLSDQIKQSEQKQKEQNEDRYNILNTQINDLDSLLLHKIAESENSLEQKISEQSRSSQNESHKLEQAFTTLSTDIAELSADVVESNQAIKHELTAQYQQLEAETQSNNIEIRQELGAQYSQLAAETKSNNEEIRQDLGTKYSQLEAETLSNNKKTQQKLEEKYSQLQTENRIGQEKIRSQLAVQYSQLQKETQTTKVAMTQELDKQYSLLREEQSLAKKQTELAQHQLQEKTVAIETNFKTELERLYEDFMVENEQNMLSVNDSLSAVEKTLLKNKTEQQESLASLKLEHVNKLNKLDKNTQELANTVNKDFGFVRAQVNNLDKVMNQGRLSVEHSIRTLKQALKEEMQHTSKDLDASKVNKNDLAIMLQQLASQINSDE